MACAPASAAVREAGAWSGGTPLAPLQQLVSVLPPSSCGLLPASWRPTLKRTAHRVWKAHGEFCGRFRPLPGEDCVTLFGDCSGGLHAGDADLRRIGSSVVQLHAAPVGLLWGGVSFTFGADEPMDAAK